MTSPKASDDTVRRGDLSERLAELIAQVGSGDRTAFTHLYDELSPLVHGTSLRVLRDPDHAAEVTQEVMVEIWRQAPRFDRRHGSAKAWAATIAHRRAVDRVRSVQSQRERDERDATRTYEPPRDVVAEEAELRVERRRLLGCLETLSEVQRTAVVSAYYDGYTYREVAQRAEVALPTMKSRIRDGLIRLRQCLEVKQ